MKKCFMVIEEKIRDTLVQGIAKMLLLLFFKGHANRSGREYAFLQFMDCTRPLDGTEKTRLCVS